MSVAVCRRCFDFIAREYQSTDRTVSILAEDDGCPAKDPRQARPDVYPHQLAKGEFIQRWHLSLHGEERPFLSESGVAAGRADQHVYRYDWAFGFSLLEGYYWDWTNALEEEGGVAVHVALQATAHAAEAVPVLATLTALQPSRHTRSVWESALPVVPRAAADVARLGAATWPALDHVASALAFGANVLESHTTTQRNWFLYQFFDERRKCPVVEWRINRRVLREYGPLLRGSLFLVFAGRPEETASIRVLLRPQVRYCPTDEITFIIPTDELPDDRQVALAVKPVARPGANASK